MTGSDEAKPLLRLRPAGPDGVARSEYQSQDVNSPLSAVGITSQKRHYVSEQVTIAAAPQCRTSSSTTTLRALR
ncbi:MAG: hypothetical protein ACREYC_10740 [Gammaproteobacteria bacterium]